MIFLNLNWPSKLFSTIQSKTNSLLSLSSNNPILYKVSSTALYNSPAISPYDKSSVADIEKAINAANLGVNPTSDGEVIRISVPALTEERRKELVKEVSRRVARRILKAKRAQRQLDEALGRKK